MPRNDKELYETQVMRQYENEMTTKHKKKLNFLTLKKLMRKMSDDRCDELSGLISEKTIRELQSSMNDGQFTSKELVIFYLKRIEKYNPQLNALIELNPDALKLAEKADKKRKKHAGKSLLLGIPVILKDNIGTKDKMHNTAGAKVLDGSSVNRDASVVKKIKKHGGIILGKANMSEWAYQMSSNGVCGYSALGGQTKNPYGSFDVGGSSSGSAVSIAMNLASVAIGSETCGSIIYPASQNNIVGLKPTLGLWSSKRIIPIAESFDTAGPMTRSVEDAALLTYYLKDPTYFNLGEFESYFKIEPCKRYRLGVINNPIMRTYDRNEDEILLNQAVKDLEKLGFEVDQVIIDESAFEVDLDGPLEYEFKKCVADYLKRTLPGKRNISSLRDIWKYNKIDLKTRAPYGQDLIEKSVFTDIRRKECKEIINRDRSICQNAINRQLSKYDGLISLSNHFSLVYAYAGYPALTVPAGFRSTGEPLGLTFVAGPFEESKLITMGYIYEQGTKHRRPV
ncbi:MAG: amidase family protein [Eubacteriales bacterium]|nr:amidase family protein [Eubacteriales bacterium]